jgi:hypothetical protein
MTMPLIGLLLVGCTEDKGKVSQEDKGKGLPTSIQNHIDDGQVVIVNTSSNLNEILTGSRKAYNLSLMFQFLDDVEAKKDSDLKFTIVDKNGKSTTNDLKYQSGEFIYTNNYKGYELPVGKFHCTDINDNGSSQLTLDGCKEPEAISNMPTVLFTASDYQAAKKEYRASKK